MDFYFSSRLAVSTCRTYSTGINKYLEFCHLTLILPIPASEQSLCKFVTSLASNYISANSMKVYLSAVRQLHLQNGVQLPDIERMARLTQVLRGIRITQQASPQAHLHQRLPISPSLLQRIKPMWEALPLTNDRIMLWAAFLMCFFSFMRSGEICSDSALPLDPASGLSVNDLLVHGQP